MSDLRALTRNMHDPPDHGDLIAECSYRMGPRGWGEKVNRVG